VALQGRAAGVTDAIAVLLQAGCHLEFVREDIFAEAVRVVAASSFLGGRMRQRVFERKPRRCRATVRLENKEREAWHSSQTLEQGDKRPLTIARNRAASGLELKREIKSSTA